MEEFPFESESVGGFFKRKIEKINHVLKKLDYEFTRQNSGSGRLYSKKDLDMMIQDKKELTEQLNMYTNNLMRISTGDYPNCFTLKRESKQEETSL